MNTSYTAFFPTILHAGPGARTKILETARLFQNTPEICLVASKSALASRPGQEFYQLIKPCLVTQFTEVRHDPTVDTVDRIRKQIAQTGANMVIALGGGSPMDAAKAAAFLAREDRPTADFLNGRATMPTQGLPCIALPTTAGTGAEITRNAVLTDPDENLKMSIRAPRMAPVAALCDPDFTLNLPASVTAHAGMDALTQAMESFLSSRASNLTRPLAAQAAGLLATFLPQAFAQPDDREARNRVAEASMLTACAFAQSGLGSVHGLAHPIGHLLDLPHGLTCAILLPHCFQFNLRHDTDKKPYAQLAQACGFPTPVQLLEHINTLNQTFGIPDTFREYGLKEDHIDYILTNCRSGSMKANPVYMSDEQIRELLARITR